jgi:serine/threonine-protein kinase HipA
LLRIPQEDFCQALAVPPTRKYNNDGGPGIRECLGLLAGSDYAEEDRLAFLKAQIVFWLIGATDGHAKNFSLFLTPGGRYRMAPLYDIMSLQPNYAAKQLRRKEFRLSMAVGDNRHYAMESILPYHFLEDAKAAGMAQDRVRSLFGSLGETIEGALERTVAIMPDDFPQLLVERIGDAMHKRSARLLT